MTVDMGEVRKVRRTIERLTVQLAAARQRRAELMRAMDGSMSRRHIGRVWGVSNQYVTACIGAASEKRNSHPIG